MAQSANPVAHPLDAPDLVVSGLATSAPTAGARLLASRDVMFALGLARPPAERDEMLSAI